MPPTSSSVPSPSAASPVSGSVTVTTTAWTAPMNLPTAVRGLCGEGFWPCVKCPHWAPLCAGGVAGPCSVPFGPCSVPFWSLLSPCPVPAQFCLGPSSIPAQSLLSSCSFLLQSLLGPSSVLTQSLLSSTSVPPQSLLSPCSVPASPRSIPFQFYSSLSLVPPQSLLSSCSVLPRSLLGPCSVPAQSPWAVGDGVSGSAWICPAGILLPLTSPWRTVWKGGRSHPAPGCSSALQRATLA